MQAFESSDVTFSGALDAKEAMIAAVELHRLLDVRYEPSMGVYDFRLTPGNFGDPRTNTISFYPWLRCVSKSNLLSEDICNALGKADVGLRCICGAWMERLRCGDCYDNGGVRCDFSGRSVLSDEVWHCPRGKVPMHPYGQDVGTENTDASRWTQQSMALERRVSTKLSEEGLETAERSRLEAIRLKLCRELIPTAMCAFTAISDDLARVEAEVSSSHHTSSSPASVALTERLRRVKHILEIEDWQALYQDACTSANIVISGLDGGLGRLHHSEP